MVFSSVFKLLGFAALAVSLPTSQDVAQMAELKAETDSFIASYPPERAQALERYLADVTGESAALACEDVYLIFVRGTFEPAGTDNLGYVVGMPFLAALKEGLGDGRVGGTGVDYSNSVTGYLSGGDSAGGICRASDTRVGLMSLRNYPGEDDSTKGITMPEL
jgi:cutinase